MRQLKHFTTNLTTCVSSRGVGWRGSFFSSCNIPAFLPGHFRRERVSPSNFAPYFICMLPIKWTGMESLGKRRRGISQMSKQISVKTRRVQTRHSLLGRIIATNLFLKPCNWTLFLFFFFSSWLIYLKLYVAPLVFFALVSRLSVGKLRFLHLFIYV